MKEGKQKILGSAVCSHGISCQSSVLDRSMRVEPLELLTCLALIRPHWECKISSYNWHSCFCKVGSFANSLTHEKRYQYVSRRKCILFHAESATLLLQS